MRYVLHVYSWRALQETVSSTSFSNQKIIISHIAIKSIAGMNFFKGSRHGCFTTFACHEFLRGGTAAVAAATTTAATTTAATTAAAASPHQQRRWLRKDCWRERIFRATSMQFTLVSLSSFAQQLTPLPPLHLPLLVTKNISIKSLFV